jgi:glycosyl transferase family 4
MVFCHELRSDAGSMRILLIVEAFRCIGGIEEVVDHLAFEFSRHGHHVAVLSTPYVPAGCERIPLAQVECLYSEIPGRKISSLRHPERLFRRPPGVAELSRMIGGWRPDVVSSHEWQWDKFPTIGDACRNANAPFVQSLYDWRGRGKLGDSPLRALNRAAALTALSHATRRYFEPLVP